jgi:hypothetical protein
MGLRDGVHGKQANSQEQHGEAWHATEHSIPPKTN